MSTITTALLKERTGLKIKFSTLDELYALQDVLTELLPARPTAVAEEKPKKIKKATKAPAPAPAPAAEVDLLEPADADATGGSAPTLGATDSLRDNKYRLQALNPALCVGRKIDEDNVLAGTRPGDEGAKGKVFPETQCSRKPIAGGRLCANCAKKETEYLADTSKVPKQWYGRLDEPLFTKAYVVGCEWFWSKYPEGIEGARPDASVVTEKPKKASKKAKSATVEPVAEEAPAVAPVEAEKPKKAKKPKTETTTPAPVAEEEPVEAEKPKKAKKPKTETATPAPMAEEEPAIASVETEKPKKGSKKASVADTDVARDVEWVSFMHEGTPLIRNTKTSNCYQCDRSKHRLEEMVQRDKYEGKWRKGRLDSYAEEDEE